MLLYVAVRASGAARIGVFCRQCSQSCMALIMHSHMSHTYSNSLPLSTWLHSCSPGSQACSMLGNQLPCSPGVPAEDACT